MDNNNKNDNLYISPKDLDKLWALLEESLNERREIEEPLPIHSLHSRIIANGVIMYWLNLVLKNQSKLETK